MTTREALHELVDELPESMLADAELTLSRLKRADEDPFWRALDEAPLDDEPLTDEDVADIQRGRVSLREGRGVPQSEVERLLGL